MNYKYILTTILVMSVFSGTASAWLTGYDHRMAITVNNGGASPLSYYQFNFTNDTNVLVAAGEMQASGADCRITDASDNLLPFWNETPFNATGTKIWVNATTLAVGNNTFYMYYGNAGASSVVSGDSTFEFFHDFKTLESGTGYSLNQTWSYNLSQTSWNEPGSGCMVAIANITSDPGNEMVASFGVDWDYDPTPNGSLNLFTSTGSLLWTHRSTPNDYCMLGDVGDIDGDGNLDIAVGTRRQDHSVMAVYGNGTTMWEYEASGDNNYVRDTAVGNVTADPGNEVAICNRGSGGLILLNSSGGFLWQFNGMDDDPQRVSIADLDGDGQNEVIAASGSVYAINSTGHQIWSKAISSDTTWGMEVGELRNDHAGLEIVVADDDQAGHGKIYLLDKNGDVIWTYTAPNEMYSVAIGNVTGDSANEIVVGGREHLLIMDAYMHVLVDNPMPSADAQVGCKDVAIGDVDGDGQNEILAAYDLNGYIYLYDVEEDTSPSYVAGWIGDVSTITGNVVYQGKRCGQCNDNITDGSRYVYYPYSFGDTFVYEAMFAGDVDSYEGVGVGLGTQFAAGLTFRPDFLTYYYDSGSYNSTTVASNTSTWYNVKLVSKGGTGAHVDVYINDSLELSNQQLADLPNDLLLSFVGNSGTGNMYVTDTRVRQYASPEPVATLGAEETGGGGCGAYNITLPSGWSLIGWTNPTASTAHAVGTSIGGNCTFVGEFNSTTMSMVYHHMTVPAENNFATERGYGYWVLTSAETVWERDS